MPMNNRRSILLLAMLLPLGCSSFNRHPRSGYGPEARPIIEVERASSTTGEAETLSLRTRLKQLENSLRTKKEVDQYSKALPFLEGEHERIEFLEQPGYEARQKWMVNNRFTERPGRTQREMMELVEAQDIAVGMPQHLVKKAWGEPEYIEVSGNPKFRNERWRYSKYVSTPEGFKLEKKVVYFEAGKVAGWEVE